MEKRLENNKGDLTSGNMIKKMLIFILPVAVGNICSQFYNVADSAVVGQMVSSSALAAVGSCFAIQMIINSIFAGLGNGSMAVCSQYFGAKDKEGTARAVTTALFMALMLGLALTVVGLIISKPLLQLINTPASILDDAVLYLRINFIGSAWHIVFYMGGAMVRGIGDTVLPFILSIVSSVLNIVLDVILVLIMDSGVAAVAIATIIAELVAAAILVWRIASGKYGFKITRASFRPVKSMVVRIAKIAIPSAIQGVSVAVGQLIVQTYVNHFGEDVVAANTVVQKVDGFALLIIMAISTGVSAFVGQNMGAGKLDRVKRVIPVFGSFSVAYGLVAGGVIWLLAEPVSKIFTSNAAVIAFSAEALRIVALSYWALGLYNLFVSFFRGSGDATPPMIIALISSVLQIPMCYYFAIVRDDYKGLFFTFCIVAVLNLAMSFGYYLTGRWKRKSITSATNQ